MKLFGKKPGDMKTLSEKEIQVKLYGHLRQPHAGASQPALPQPSVRPASSIANPKTQVLTHEDRRSASFAQEAAVSRVQASAAAANKPAQSAAKPVKAKTAFWLPVISFLTGKLLPGIWKIFKGVLTLIAQIFVTVIGIVSQLFLKIDFKNPRVRRAFSWTFGIGLLVFLLAGIHLLNVKREIAMKHPRAVPVKPKQHRQKQQIPAQVTSQALLSEAATAENGEAQAPSTTAAGVTTAATGTPAAVTGAETAPAESAANIHGQVIQIATFAAQADADKLVERLKADTWKCFVKPLVRAGGRTYYCVFLGPYKTYQEAETKLNSFKKKEIAKSFQDAFIRSL